MMKRELESRIGYQITRQGFDTLNAMYMACELDKDEFAALVKQGARIYQIEDKSITNYRGINVKYSDVFDCWMITTCISAQLMVGQYHDDYAALTKAIDRYIERGND